MSFLQTYFFDHYAAIEYPLAASQLILAMFGMGLLLTPRDFVREVQEPKGLLLGLGFQWALVPLIAVLVGMVMPIPVGIAVGLILVASVPGGTMSNILTLYGKGNIALSIALTSVTTVAALVTTPILLKLLVSSYLPPDFAMPAGQIATDIFFTLIVPLVLGMSLRSRFKEASAVRVSAWSIRLSIALIVLIAIGAGGSGRMDAREYGLAAILAILTFAFVVQIVGFLVSRAIGLSSRDGLAIVIEATFRNISLAVAVKASVFPARVGVADPIADEVFFVAMLYGGVTLFLCLVPVLLHRRVNAVG